MIIELQADGWLHGPMVGETDGVSRLMDVCRQSESVDGFAAQSISRDSHDRLYWFWEAQIRHSGEF